jgi:hypothetical protein
MKTKIIAILISLTTFVSAQISIDNVQTENPEYSRVSKSANELVAKINYYTDTLGTYYVLCIGDMQYTKIFETKCAGFYGNNGELMQLYHAMKSFFIEPNKKNENYSLSLTLGDDKVHLSHYKIMGIRYVTINIKGGYNYLREKDVDKLFKME